MNIDKIQVLFGKENKMTKSDLINLLEDYDDDDEIDFAEIERQRMEFIEELEERQHQSGFYAFQDMMEMRRREQ